MATFAGDPGPARWCGPPALPRWASGRRGPADGGNVDGRVVVGAEVSGGMVVGAAKATVVAGAGGIVGVADKGAWLGTMAVDEMGAVVDALGTEVAGHNVGGRPLYLR